MSAVVGQVTSVLADISKQNVSHFVSLCRSMMSSDVESTDPLQLGFGVDVVATYFTLLYNILSAVSAAWCFTAEDCAYPAFAVLSAGDGSSEHDGVPTAV